MLITHSFVMLNMPKTGSTFVRTAIKEIYEERRKNAPLTYKLLKKIKPLSGFANPEVSRKLFIEELKLTTSNRLPKNQHGFYCQIPSEYLNREVISVIRNPFDRFLSMYKYGWWTHSPRIDREIILKHLPNYPNLSVNEYVDLLDLFEAYSSDYEYRSRKNRLGPQTSVFIRMFSEQPGDVFSKIDEESDFEEIFSGLADVAFIRQENLAEELASFLERHSFSGEEIDHVKSKKRVNTSRKSADDGKELWTPKALAYVEEKESLLFKILEKRGITYSPSEYKQTVQAIL